MKINPIRGSLSLFGLALGAAVVMSALRRKEQSEMVDKEAWLGDAVSSSTTLADPIVPPVPFPSPKISTPPPPEEAMPLGPKTKAKAKKAWYRMMPWRSMVTLYALSAGVIMVTHKAMHEPLARHSFSALNSVRLAVRGSSLHKFLVVDPRNFQVSGGEIRGDFFRRLEKSLRRMAEMKMWRSHWGPTFIGVVPDLSPYEKGQSAQHAESLSNLQSISSGLNIPVSVSCGRRVLAKQGDMWGLPGIDVEGVSTFASISGQDYPLLFMGPNGPIRSMAEVAAKSGPETLSIPFSREEELERMSLGSNSKVSEGAYIPEEDFARIANNVKTVTPKVRSDGFLFSEEEERLLVDTRVFVAPLAVDEGGPKGARPIGRSDLQSNDPPLYAAGVYEQIAAAIARIDGLRRFPEGGVLTLDLATCAGLIFIVALFNALFGKTHGKHSWPVLMPALFALAVVSGTLIAAACGYLFDPSLGLLVGMGFEALFAHSLTEYFHGHGVEK